VYFGDFLLLYLAFVGSTDFIQSTPESLAIAWYHFAGSSTPQKHLSRVRFEATFVRCAMSLAMIIATLFLQTNMGEMN
jgi:hypothetical protein